MSGRPTLHGERYSPTGNLHRVVIALTVISLVLLLAWGSVVLPSLSSCYAGVQGSGTNRCEFLTYDVRTAIQGFAFGSGLVALVAAVQARQRKWLAVILVVLVFYVAELGGLAGAIGCAVAAPLCLPTLQGAPDFVNHLADVDHLLPLLLPLTTTAYSVLITARGRPRPVEGLEASSLNDPDGAKLPGQRAEQ